jgi:glycosyltransferase involved in cell wall biosynthesis
MKIIFDNIVFFLQHSGGVSVYWSENIVRLDKRKVDIHFFEPRGETKNIFYSKIRKNLNHSIHKEFWTSKLLSFIPFTAKVTGPHIFHSSYYRTSTSANAINVITIHDFIPERFFRGFRWFYHTYRKKRAIKNADAIICVSQNTYNDLLQNFPEVMNKPLKIIHLGISEDYYPLHEYSRSKQYLEYGKYILFVGRRADYKNFSFVVDLLIQLKKYHLVIVGESLKDDEILSLSLLKSNFTLVLNPENRELNQLYNNAFCLLYPSSYEGFGIPVIEAMKAGCPVVAQNVSSIPEIADNAALLINELAVPQFSEAITSLENIEVRQNLISQGLKNARRFNWGNAENELFLFYESLFKSYNR